MASSSSFDPVPQKVMDILHGYCASQSLFVACELGILDVLCDTGVPQSAKDIAEQLSTDPDATSRLLDVLVSLELLVKQTTTDEPLYSNSSVAYCLTKSSPSCFHAIMKEYITNKALMENLTDAVRQGTNQWKETFKTSSEFEDVYSKRETLFPFLECMRAWVKTASPTFVTSFDLSRFKQMCDLGGGTGDVAYTFCMAYPNMKITVLDLKLVVENALRFRPSMDVCPNQQNVTFVEGNFNEPTLPAADLYVLTHIVRGLSEAEADTLFSNIFKNLPSGGGILLGEMCLFDDKSGPLIAQYWSLLMLLICNGRERSGLEYKLMLEKNGFKDVQVKYTHTNSLDAVLAIKP